MLDEEEISGDSLHHLARSPRLIIRSADRHDWAAVARLAQDPGIIMAQTALPFPNLQKQNDTADPKWLRKAFVIEHRQSDQLIGLATYGRLEDQKLGYTLTSEQQRNTHGNERHMVVWIAAQARGRGFGTEAAQAVINILFTHHPHTALLAASAIGQEDARRVTEKCGFQPNGMQMIAAPHNGLPTHVNQARLCRKTWQALRNWVPNHQDVSHVA